MVVELTIFLLFGNKVAKSKDQFHRAFCSATPSDSRSATFHHVYSLPNEKQKTSATIFHLHKFITCVASRPSKLHRFAPNLSSRGAYRPPMAAKVAIFNEFRIEECAPMQNHRVLDLYWAFFFLPDRKSSCRMPKVSKTSFIKKECWGAEFII